MWWLFFMGFFKKGFSFCSARKVKWFSSGIFRGFFNLLPVFRKEKFISFFIVCVILTFFASFQLDCLEDWSFELVTQNIQTVRFIFFGFFILVICYFQLCVEFRIELFAFISSLKIYIYESCMIFFIDKKK